MQRYANLLELTILESGVVAEVDALQGRQDVREDLRRRWIGVELISAIGAKSQVFYTSFDWSNCEVNASS